MDNLPLPKHILITGGTRSGKSQFAEIQAGFLGGQVIYLATGEAQDEEMKKRILKHRQRRPPEWLTIEAPLEIAGVLHEYQEGYTILLDCLTLYLSNLYFKYEQLNLNTDISDKIQWEISSLAQTIKTSKAHLIIVSNEVGWGIVPEHPAGRIFRDLAGLANQMIAAVCDQVYLVVSGVPVKIKGELNV